MANKTKDPSKDDGTSRNNGRGQPSVAAEEPNPNNIHSDDPLVAGLANGERQGDDSEDSNAGTVK